MSNITESIIDLLKNQINKTKNGEKEEIYHGYIIGTLVSALYMTLKPNNYEIMETFSKNLPTYNWEVLLELLDKILKDIE